MNRLKGRPLLIFLVGAGALMTVYSLTLLPLAVTLLVVGLVAIGGAVLLLYPPGPAHPAELSEPAAVSEPAVVSAPAAVSAPAELSEPAAVSELAADSSPEEVSSPEAVSGLTPGETITLLPEQWQMLQRWMEIAAQGQAVADAWAPPEVADESEPESTAPVAQPLALLPPEPVALALRPEPSPAPQATAPQAEPPAGDPEEEENLAPPAARSARRASPVVAQATTYQDGEITKRSQITLRLSGRMRR